MAKKKNSDADKIKVFTASHAMLYVFLIIYIIVTISGILLLKKCMDVENYECAGQIFVSICALCGTCSSVTVGFYVTKAMKENEIKISNSKYKMRLDLVKEIYKSFEGKKIDDKSIQFMRVLISDKDVDETSPDYTPPTATTISMPNVDVTNFIKQNDSEEGLG